MNRGELEQRPAQQKVSNKLDLGALLAPFVLEAF